MSATPVPKVATMTTTEDLQYGPVIAGIVANVKMILLVNKTGTAQQPRVYRKKDGTKYEIRPDLADTLLDPGQVETWSLDLFLGEGEEIYTENNNNSAVDFHLSVVEMEVT